MDPARRRIGLLLGALALGAPAQAPSQPGGERGEVLDRIVAVVEGEAILQTDIDRAILFHAVVPQEGESEAAHRRRVLDWLIDQRLRFREMGRFGGAQVSMEEIDAQVEAIRAGLPDERAYRERLRELDLTEQDLRQLLIRQRTILDYVEQRLGPRVFVTVEDDQAYYERELVPMLEARGAPVPPFEEVQPGIRALLEQLRRNEELERWTAELRREADIEILVDDYPDDLPPVVERIGEPP